MANPRRRRGPSYNQKASPENAGRTRRRRVRSSGDAFFDASRLLREIVERTRTAASAIKGGSLPRTRRGRYRCAAACLAASAAVTCLMPMVLMAGIDDRGGRAVPQYLRARRRRGVPGGIGALLGGGHRWTPRRRRPDEDPVPLLIPRFSAGGVGRPRRPAFGGLPKEEDFEGSGSGSGSGKEKGSSEEDDGDERPQKYEPDYGGFDMAFLDEGEARNIHRDEDARHGHVYVSEDFEDGNDDWVDSYYALDDDAVRHPTCRRNNWYKLARPNCNQFHAFGMLDKPRNKYISHGYFRDVFALKDAVDEDTVLKALRLKKKRFKPNRGSMENTRKDALIMERLSASPRVVDIYGYCGTSVLTESLPVDLHKVIEPTSGYLSQEDMDENFGPRNELEPTEKLTLALEMAEAIADLHGFDGGIIVHDDVQLQQFLRAKDGTLKINDFNRAEMMLWDDRKEEYCTYKNGGGYGNYRSPEEWADDPLNEKIDVYSYGNNVYGLLTGMEPFYANEDDTVVHDKMAEKETPFIDDRYRTKRSFAEAQLAELLDKCWAFDPDDRISIFEAVKFLREAVEKNKQHNRQLP